MKLSLIRVVEVALIRAVARDDIPPIVEAENLAPGNGTVFMWDADGRKVKVTIEYVT